jgi:hypothetical protein
MKLKGSKYQRTDITFDAILIKTQVDFFKFIIRILFQFLLFNRLFNFNLVYCITFLRRRPNSTSHYSIV